MNKTLLFIVCCLFFGTFSFAQKKELSYYLPDGNYNPTIPTPESVLGYQVGEWHVSHDQLVIYMRELARASDRINIVEYGRSYENRPLVLLTISSPKNLGNIDHIKTQHLSLSNPEKSSALNTAEMPAIIYQGYSIHGNEASGSNASILYAYHLAAAQGPAIEETLDKVVILLDPSYNPDGFNRFASWVNVHKSKNLSPDPANREYNETFPRGRTNHYWFDLNRDWLPAQHPESQGRLKNFHEWMPLILTDHHEMGTNNTFFFQPGIPSRANPITPKKNQELTYKIGTFHAKWLDKIGSLYYSQESFDDFYYGKGSTYPDVNGSVGILFEQASSRGHLQESDHGIISFPFTIRNQLQTSLSTLAAGQAMRKELLDYHREFYQSAMELAKKDKEKAYVFGTAKKNSRVQAFLTMLKRHQIKINQLAKNTRIKGQAFSKENAYVVSLDQRQYRLIKAMFSKVTTFRDSLFYDVSAWTLPLSFNIPYASVGATELGGLMGTDLNKIKNAPIEAGPAFSDYAYLFEWDDYAAPNALNRILKEGLLAKVANKTFTSLDQGNAISYPAGTLMIPVQNNQSKTPQEIHAIVQEASLATGIRFIPTNTGFTPEGIDLGSPSFSMLKKPEVLLLIGNGVSSYDAGEVWHLLDQRYDMSLTLMDLQQLPQRDLSRYNTIVMVSGSYSQIRDIKPIKKWLRDGGTLIAMKSAVRWATSNGLANVSFKSAKKEDRSPPVHRPYNKLRADNGAKVIGGAIFQTQLDLTHPICYGYQQNTLPVFRRGTLFFEPGHNLYSTPVRYTDNPLLSGYISKANLKLLKSSASIVVSGYGKGRVICMADNPNFRAFWYGTNRLFANSIFFGSTISSRSTESAPAVKEKK